MRNTDLDNIVTPVKVEELERLLKLSKYDAEETNFLVDGFKNGFNIGYEGPVNRQDLSKNIPFRDGMGSPQELWGKTDAGSRREMLRRSI